MKEINLSFCFCIGVTVTAVAVRALSPNDVSFLYVMTTFILTQNKKNSQLTMIKAKNYLITLKRRNYDKIRK